jgi:hypothetical protein
MLRRHHPKDNIMTGTTTTITSSAPAPATEAGARFEVQGLVGIQVAPHTPGTAQLLDMLGPFLGQAGSDAGAPAATIRVTAAGTPLAHASRAEDAYRHTEESLFLPRDRVTVCLTEDGFSVAGNGELLTAIIPLLDRLCVLQGAAMVHAAVVSDRGRGVLMPAWGGVGKTSTVAKLVTRDGGRFLADDWAFLRADGQLLAYAKPMFIKAHHQPIYPHLFSGARKPMAPTRLTRPLEQLATTVHPVIVRYPRTAAFTRHWSPEHRMVHPVDVFGPDRLAQQAPVRVAIFLERFDGAEAVLEPRDPDWMTTRIVGNFHSELPTVSQRLITALGATGLVPLPEHFADKAKVVHQGLVHTPCYLLKLPADWSADRASDQVAATVHAVLDEHE